MASLKKLKEEFVSDLTGGSIEEIYLVTSIALTSYLSFKLLKDCLGSISLTYDYILNVLSIIISITIYSGNPIYLHYSIFIPCFGIFLLNHYTRSDKTRTKVKSQNEILSKKQFLTAYRSHMLIITNLAILAVDFKIFPRRFAKVETWGTSMMDLGVGSFVFSMGLVNSRQIIKSQLHSKTYKFSLTSWINIITKNTVKALPILILGIVRFISVKQLEYQEHITEYGIHWNFFITLGLLPILLGILDPLLNLIPRVIIGFTLLGINELILQSTNVLEVILTENNRLTNFITMNKEGIYSFLGYFTIFIFGQSFGSFVLTNHPTKYNLITFINKSLGKKSSFFASIMTVTTTKGLIISTIFYQTVFYLVNSSAKFTSISRRIANPSYILWVVSYNSTFLLGYNLIDKFIPGFDKETSILLESINNNGLIIFLLSNLLTGLINMSLNTLNKSNTESLFILIGYSSTWCFIAFLLNKYKIYIKL
ncbi:GWT1 [Candida pseudojiufengensis]|uniref:GWT1 n=1 Tax=Candida pseudojiufengensis TaxID=497109 RepID=UPI0022253499|nr:GWT1 [Candida pseudojiufengensis]KAI5959016.1 GWT1 [Candida pseudojiufengensis]